MTGHELNDMKKKGGYFRLLTDGRVYKYDGTVLRGIKGIRKDGSGVRIKMPDNIDVIELVDETATDSRSQFYTPREIIRDDTPALVTKDAEYSQRFTTKAGASAGKTHLSTETVEKIKKDLAFGDMEATCSLLLEKLAVAKNVTKENVRAAFDPAEPGEDTTALLVYKNDGTVEALTLKEAQEFVKNVAKVTP